MKTLLDPPAPARPAAGTAAAPRPQETAAPDWFVWACPCCQVSLRTVATARRGACPACGSLIEAPEIAATAAPPPARKGAGPWLRRHGLKTLALAGAALGLGLLVRALPPPAATPGLSDPRADAPPSTEALRQTLDRFLRAPDWAAKRAFILDAPRLEPVGSVYYQGRDADEVQAADFHAFPAPGLAGVTGVAALRAERPGRRPVLALFRHRGRAWQLDWEFFTQTYDDALPAFIATPAFAHRTFRTRLNRVFTTASEDPSFAVEIADVLDPGQRITFRLPPGTPIMGIIASGLVEGSPRDATVEVCWAQPEPGGEWVPLLQKLVCWGWLGLNGQPEPAVAAGPPANGFSRPAAAPLDSAAPAAETAAAAAAPE